MGNAIHTHICIYQEIEGRREANVTTYFSLGEGYVNVHGNYLANLLRFEIFPNNGREKILTHTV